MIFKQQAKHLVEGNAAEQLAATFLQQNGLKLIEKNFRCPHGEIDLIMQDGKTLVFIEVRLRSSANFGGAAMSITPSKQQKLTRTAERYLQIHGNTACRFDVVLMQSTNLNAVEWIQNAF
ncbi:MAG: YraN family protein [Methylotenera sp.]|jgi:putative endonuclease|nr:YraN family protein [Methylotenera sp.]